MKYEVRRKEKESSSLRNSDFRLLRGFTLIEILVYITVLVIVIVAISSLVVWAIKANTKAKVMRETLDSARRAMEIMVYEIREAGDVYAPTSVFGSHPGQLSLGTQAYSPEGESSTYIDFYICDGRLCLKKESQDPIALTSETVEVQSLIFEQIITDQIPSVQINLGIAYKDSTGKPEYQASVNLKSAASLR